MWPPYWKSLKLVPSFGSSLLHVQEIQFILMFWLIHVHKINVDTESQHKRTLLLLFTTYFT